eukprot:UN25970
MRHICKSHGLSLNIPGIVEGKDAVYSALLLGELLWMLPTLLQDAFCILGGEGSLFGQFHLSGCKAICGAGRVHKARSGYRVNIHMPFFTFDVAVQSCSLEVIMVEDYPGHTVLIALTEPYAGYMLRKVDFDD